MKIAKTAIIHPNVTIGEGSIIEDFCIIGAPTKDQGFLPTIIGENAHIRSHTVIYAGNTVGSYFTTGNKTNIRESNHIGNNVSIGTLSDIAYSIRIENNVRIHSQVFIPEFSTLCENCWIGPNTVLTNSKYPCSNNAKKELVGPTIGKRAIIGANCTVLPGIYIAEDSLIAAGSVVTRDTIERGLYQGSPAQYIKNKKDINAYENSSL